MNSKIRYYDLQPVYASDPRPMIATAALRTCIATGRVIEGMGGPGYSLSAEFVQAVDMTKPNAKARRLVELADLKAILLDIENGDIDQAKTKLIESINGTEL